MLKIQNVALRTLILEEFSVMGIKVFNFFEKEPMRVLNLLKKREKKGLS